MLDRLFSTSNGKMNSLDSATNELELRSRIFAKPALMSFYNEIYSRYRFHLSTLHSKKSIAIELGSGASFAKMTIPDLTTTDILPYRGVDMVVDACEMPFANETVDFFFLLNTLHHIPNAEAFFREADRCLKPGGSIVIFDQNRGFFSEWILRFFHHEPYDPNRTSWDFPSTGPVSGANGALAWIIFERDREKFKRLFPRLQIVNSRPFSPLLYWVSGGLKGWTLAPSFLVPFWRTVDSALLSLDKRFGSFIEIQIVKGPA